MSFLNYLKENDQITRNLSSIINPIIDNCNDWKIIDLNKIGAIIAKIINIGFNFSSKTGKNLGYNQLVIEIITLLKSLDKSALSDEKTNKIVEKLMELYNVKVSQLQDAATMLRDKKYYD
jgi:hypothetical protein